MLGIKHARLRNGQVNALLRRNTQTRAFELGVDLGRLDCGLLRLGLMMLRGAFDGHMP